MARVRFGRSVWLVPLLCAALAGLTSLGAYQVGSSVDDALYVNEATAIARGMGYVRLWPPTPMPETSYAPGYPALLAPLRRLFPNSFVPLQLLSLAATVAAVALFAWYCWRRLPMPLAWIVPVFVAVNVGTVKFSMQVMSEAVYVFLMLAVFVLVEREDSLGKERPAWLLLVGLLTTVAYFVRSWGIALIGALLVYYLWRRRWLGIACLVIPFGLAYMLWWHVSTTAGGVATPYGVAPSAATPFIQRLAADLPGQIYTHWIIELPEWFFTPRLEADLARFGLAFLTEVARPLVLLVLVCGFLVQARSRLSVAELCIIGYLGILTLAPAPNSRYWVRALPILILYFVLGLRVALGAFPPLRKGERLEKATILLVCAFVLLHGVRDVQNMLVPPGQTIPNVAIGPSWLAKHTPPDTLVMSAVPRVSYLYSQRRSVPFPDSKGEMYDPYVMLQATDRRARLYEALQDYPVDYVLVEPVLAVGLPFKWDEYTRAVVVPVLEEDRVHFNRVYSDTTGLVRVYQVLR